MTWLGLLYSVAYVPAFTGAVMQVVWAVMSLTLPWVTWRSSQPTPCHWLGAAFILYVVASLWWTDSPYDAIADLWHWVLIAFAFLLGTTRWARGMWKGVAIGVGISSAIALLQWFGCTAIPMSDWGKPSGLFYNSAVSGAVAAITLIALIANYLWLYIPLTLPLLFLSHSRGAWVAVLGTWWCNLLIGLKWFERVGLIALTLPILTLAWIYLHGPTDPYRISLWIFVLDNLSWFGHGAGSFMAVYIQHAGQVFHAEHAHNDFLTLTYQYGLGILPLVVLVATLLRNTEHESWQILVCGLILSLYFWPLETPLIACMLGLVAGNMAIDSAVAGWDSYPLRLGDILRHGLSGPFASRARG